MSWFFLFVWFSTPGTTLLDKIAFPFGGGEVWLHIFSHFYWVHYNLSTEITQGNLPTLYKPKSPRSRSTFRALTLGPVVISPATCRRILTISRGLVKMTWEPPACRQERRDRADFQISPTGSTGKKNPETPPHCTTLRFPLHGGMRVRCFGLCGRGSQGWPETLSQALFLFEMSGVFPRAVFPGLTQPYVKWQN